MKKKVVDSVGCGDFVGRLMMNCLVFVIRKGRKIGSGMGFRMVLGTPEKMKGDNLLLSFLDILSNIVIGLR